MTKNKIINDGKEVINTEIQGIKKLNKIIDKKYDKADRALAKVKGRVIITGVGKSGHIASKISSTMSSTGTPSQYCSPTDMSHGDLGIISKKDALIIISNSGNSNELVNLLDFAKKYSISIIGISSNSESELIKASNIGLIIPSAAEACSIGMAPTTSTTMALIVGDALCVSLMKLKKFKISDYKKLHPGGSLGIQMLQVKDIMHTKKKMPIVTENANMKSVIIEMTKKSFGHVEGKKQIVFKTTYEGVANIINSRKREQSVSSAVVKAKSTFEPKIQTMGKPHIYLKIGAQAIKFEGTKDKGGGGGNIASIFFTPIALYIALYAS